MTRNSHSTEKIEEALQLLQEAAEDKKTEIKDLLGSKYSDLRDSVMDVENIIAGKLQELTRKVGKVGDMAGEKARDMVTNVDDHVHKDPWRVLGWSAVAAFVVGYVLGRKE